MFLTFFLLEEGPSESNETRTRKRTSDFIARWLEFIGHPAFDQFSSAVNVPGAHEQLRFDNLGESALRIAVQLALDAGVTDGRIELVHRTLRQ